MFYSFRHRRKFQVVYRKRCFQKLGWGQWFPFFVLPHLTRTKEAKKCCYPAGKAFSRDYSTAEKRKNKTALGKKQTNNTVYFSIKELKPQVLRKRVSGLGSVRSVGERALQAGGTGLDAPRLGAAASQKEGFLQVPNKALLLKHKLTAVNVQGTFPVKL